MTTNPISNDTTNAMPKLSRTSGRSRRSVLVAAAVPALLFFTAACGSDTDATADQSTGASLPAVTGEPSTDQNSGQNGEPDVADSPLVAPDTVVFVWSETGGCAMAGPNCARYEVTADGTVSTFREGADAAAGPDTTGQVDRALVDAWRNAAVGLDVDALQARVGEGEMTAAFDGEVDTESGLELSSVDMAFERTEPVFSAAIALATAAAENAPLDMEMR